AALVAAAPAPQASSSVASDDPRPDFTTHNDFFPKCPWAKTPSDSLSPLSATDRIPRMTASRRYSHLAATSILIRTQDAVQLSRTSYKRLYGMRRLLPIIQTSFPRLGMVPAGLKPGGST
ncbi:hypothetical protein K432DRAFT_472057, partial [Lepidopterella palustris CBS 459.81]